MLRFAPVDAEMFLKSKILPSWKGDGNFFITVTHSETHSNCLYTFPVIDSWWNCWIWTKANSFCQFLDKWKGNLCSQPNFKRGYLPNRHFLRATLMRRGAGGGEEGEEREFFTVACAAGRRSGGILPRDSPSFRALVFFPFPSPSDACHAGYDKQQIDSRLRAIIFFRR